MCAVFHLLTNPEELDKLKKELSVAIPDPTDIAVAQVDSLPYLNAVISESVRLHPGVMNRQVRMNPDVPIVYDNPVDGKRYVVPPNTIYSMSPLETHMNPKAFGPDPYAFRPQRWIDQPNLNKYFLGFSRGSRNCVG
jgi:cytochrome P450